jgi:hypothetical protein
MKVFVAGASGAVGRRLVPQLVAGGHQVVATTRSEAKLDALRQLGAHAVVLDGLDAAAVGSAVAEAEPEVIVHQMTALAVMGSPAASTGCSRRPTGCARKVWTTCWPRPRRPGTEGDRAELSGGTTVAKVARSRPKADGLDPDPAPARRRS